MQRTGRAFGDLVPIDKDAVGLCPDASLGAGLIGGHQRFNRDGEDGWCHVFHLSLDEQRRTGMTMTTTFSDVELPQGMPVQS